MTFDMTFVVQPGLEDPAALAEWETFRKHLEGIADEEQAEFLADAIYDAMVKGLRTEDVRQLRLLLRTP